MGWESEVNTILRLHTQGMTKDLKGSFEVDWSPLNDFLCNKGDNEGGRNGY